MENAKGTVFKYPDNVDTDVIIPARYLNTPNAKELASHCMEDIDETFTARVKDGDIITAGWNFGCGSSREHAPLAIRGAGISCIIAESFARTFFRNCINRGFLALELPGAGAHIGEGDSITVDLERGVVINESKKETYPFQPLPPFIGEICDGGGLYYYIQKRLMNKHEES